MAVGSGGHQFGLGGASLTYLSILFLFRLFGVVLWVYAIGEKQSVGENITITMYFRSYMEVPIHFALFFGSGRENKSTDKLILLIHLK